MLFAGFAATLYLVQLTGPDGQAIEVNPAQVVSLRAPRVSEHFAPGTRCLITTSDGKLLTVQELCSSVERLFEAEQRRHEPP